LHREGSQIPRDFDQIQKAALASEQVVAADNTLSLPPGYIQGFDVRLRKDYTVLINSGTANVGGIQVRLKDDHQLALADWVAPRFDNPFHYYIYLSKEGNIYVDVVTPAYNSFYGYYESPGYGWRALGRLFVKSTDIIFASPVLFAGKGQ
jgi:hypothetical protein